MFNRNAMRWTAVATAACFMLLTGLSTANAKKQGKTGVEKAKVAAEAQGEKGKAKRADQDKGKDKEKTNQRRGEQPDGVKENRKGADAEKRQGLALGKDKKQGEGLALGKDKEQGEGLALGKGHKAVEGAARPAGAGVPAQLRASKKRGPLVAEQRKHRRRLAKLQRLTVVASEQKKPELLTRVQQLQNKEQQRHAKKMAQLRMHAQKGKAKKGKLAPVAQGKALGHDKDKAVAKKEK